jgi:predicted nucleotidyltransferase
VLFVEDPPRTLAGIPSRLQADLTAAAGRPVDLVVLNRAPVDLVKRVLRDGRLIVDRDRSRRIAFEVRSRNLYWDLEPILRRYRHPHPGTP